MASFSIDPNRVYLAGDVPMSEELLRQLFRWTEAERFGAFGVDDANNVYVEGQLVASTASTETLARSMRRTHALAMARKDEVRRRFGGGSSWQFHLGVARRGGQEAPDEAGQRAAPVRPSRARPLAAAPVLRPGGPPLSASVSTR